MRSSVLRKSFATLARPILKILHSAGVIKPSVIVKIDGGIASQMHFYLVGETLRKVADPNLSYDLIWYDEVGKDINGNQIRNFDLLKLFPSLHFPRCTNALKLRLYRLLFTHEHQWDSGDDSWSALQPPLYLTGYQNPGDRLYRDMYKVFKPEPESLTEEDLRMSREIEAAGESSVGIHVRRGDLTRYIASYGNPASTAYFINAINHINRECGKKPRFFIFSDEPDWVKTELLPLLPEGDYVTVDYNDASRGYIDLWLLSKCNHIIASAGSFGKFAYMIRPPQGILTIPDNPESRHWQKKIPQSVFLPS